MSANFNRGRWNYKRRGYNGGRGMRGKAERVKWSDAENNMWKRSHEIEKNVEDEMSIGSSLNPFDENLNEKLCPQLQNIFVLGDSFALRLCKAHDLTVKGKFDLCRGGMKINELKCLLSRCSHLTFNGKDVLLLIGMNDLMKVKAEDLDGEMYSLVNKILRLDAKRVLLCTLPSLPGKLNEAIDHFNERIHDLKSLDEKISVIDLEVIFVKEDDTIDESLYEKCHHNDDYDIHPNTKGFQKIAQVILASL